VVCRECAPLQINIIYYDWGYAMNLIALEALYESIEKWYWNVLHPDRMLLGKENCSLCNLYIDNDCKECPVREYTGRKWCAGTPYCRLGHYLTLYIGNEDPQDAMRLRFISKLTGMQLEDLSGLSAIAQEELNFLIDLLPEEQM
jgi:hypothetical protein